MSRFVHLVAGARPNFMKVAPLYHQLARADWCRPVLVHTGQHYSSEMSETFIRDLDLPTPDHQLSIGSGSHAEQTARCMIAYEKLCTLTAPDLVVVVGDVNSTMACALAAKKLGLDVAHLEAGLRSGDRSMPEEINRLVTDAIADLLWTPSPDADVNLRTEGVSENRIHRVGNIMIDAYELLRDRIEAAPGPSSLGLAGEDYAVVTLHRPSNVDTQTKLEELVSAVTQTAEQIRLVFPLHPRTSAALERFGMTAALKHPRIHLLSPLGYVDFMSLVRRARLVITDSGGLQEETTYLGVPCLTIRKNTERPITVTEGTNRLIDAADLPVAVAQCLADEAPAARRPELWDGHTAERVARSIREFFTARSA